jgi:hypothetical protein
MHARACAARARETRRRARGAARSRRSGAEADRFRDAFPIRMQPRAVFARFVSREAASTTEDTARLPTCGGPVRRPPRPPGPQRGSETESPPPPAWAAHGTATRPPPRTTAHWPLARTPCDAVLPRSRVRWVGEATHGRPHGHETTRHAPLTKAGCAVGVRAADIEITPLARSMSR